MLKTLIIGLDGATFDLIGPWIKRGYLPTLAKLMKEGSWGELETVFPPITPAAWSSFLTGKNPGKHGIYDFLYREKGKYTTAPNNRLTRKATDFWKIFNKYGFSTGLINIPMTYPPAKLKGYMITGIMTPRTEIFEKVNYTYPDSLKGEIKNNVGEYIIHPKIPYRKGKVYQVYKELIEDLEIKSKTIQYLFGKYPTDIAMFVIGGTDKIQHDLYHLIDPNHHRYDEAEAKKDSHFILDYYKRVDNKIKIVTENFCDENTLVVVMSDHGMGPIYKWIYLNNWLMKNGYLSLKRTPITLIKKFLFILGFTPSNIYRLLLRFGFSKAKISFQAREKFISKLFLSWKDIDWMHTHAYSRGHIGQMFINKIRREPEGIVSDKEYSNLKEEIESKLSSLTDSSGVKVVEKILDRNKVYSGLYKEESADILFMPYHLEYMALGTSAFTSNKIIELSFGNTGDHRMNGIFIIKGKGIKKNYRIKNATIVDIVPNLLFWHNLPIDKEMDGKILKDIYEDKFFSSKKITFTNKLIKRKQKTTEEAYPEEESESIKKALKDLGYLG